MYYLFSLWRIGTGGEYDSGQDAYKKFFEELKEAADVLRTAKEKDVASFMMFDYAYGGNLNKWAQLCNTIRLRLAMRIVKYDAAWAKVRRKLHER